MTHSLMSPIIVPRQYFELYSILYLKYCKVLFQNRILILFQNGIKSGFRNRQNSGILLQNVTYLNFKVVVYKARAALLLFLT